MYEKHKTGKLGENIAEIYLINHQYEILERNFACQQGEIDIIAKYEKHLVFIEVKTRRNVYFGNPCEAVNKKKQKKIYQSAKYYLHIHQLENVYIRFDVIEIIIIENKININHIKQIF